MSLRPLTALLFLLTLGLIASAQAPLSVSTPEPEVAPEAAPTAEPAAAPTTEPAAAPTTATSEPIDVYVIPITGVINKPNLYILRRGLKEAITNQVDMVLLDMDTPGGRVDYTIEMMEMLAKFDGITATFVNPDAISAGSFIASATQEIYFAPQGKMGASAVIQGGGQDVPETARMKMESYLRANIRSITEGYLYRSDVLRAMLDADFELKIGDEVIKPAGELLTLTASEAMREYALPDGPAQPLLGSGIYDSIDELLDARFGPGNYEIKDFHITYSEVLAKWMNTFAPGLLGIGLLALFFEFKTPGFGLFGIAGIALLGVFFLSQYVAGLAGNEVVLFFAVGVLLVLVELFFFPGTLVFALSGLALIFGSLLWAMVDVWPNEPLTVSPELLAEPLVNLVFGLSIAVFGVFILSRFFPGSWMESKLVLATAAGGDSQTLRAERASRLPQPGAQGIAITDLFPSGRVEIDGRRYEARSALGSIDCGSPIQVQKTGDFSLIVTEPRDGERSRSQPSNPARPSQPSKPARPIQPSNPARPSQRRGFTCDARRAPARPIQPPNPAHPSQPSNPARRSQRRGFTCDARRAPARPIQPSNPAHPIQPSNPARPIQPSNPAHPIQPSNPASRLKHLSPSLASIFKVGRSTFDLPLIPFRPLYTQ
ncbi:NfeD family protein [Coraliomargarita sp. W4R53]